MKRTFQISDFRFQIGLLLAICLLQSAICNSLAAPETLYRDPANAGQLINTGVVKTRLHQLELSDGAAVDTTLASLASDLAAKQPLDTDLTAIAALATTAFGRDFLTLADAAAAKTKIAMAFSDLLGKPTTIAGYGITDLNSLGDARWSLLAHTHTFASLTSKPTTIAGYGIIDLNSLGDARWQPLDNDLTAIAALTTDPFGLQVLTKATAASLRTYIGAGTSSFDGVFASLTGKPTTIGGYGITDLNSLGDARWQPLDAALTALAAGSDFVQFTGPATTTKIFTLPNIGGLTLATLTGTEAFTNKDLTGAGNTFPTLNQNTTGSAAKWTTARNLAGNSVDGSAAVPFSNKFIVQGTADAGLSGPQFLGALATGIVKNATTTGVLSIAVAGDFPTLNQNTTGSAATLTTPRAIYGNNFDGSAALAGIIASTYGGTGNGFTKFSGPATTEKTKTLRDATDTILELGGSYTPTGTWTSLTLVTPVLGTPTSGNLANCTFPTLNQNTSGSAASLSISGQTGLITLTGIASTSRIKTVRDAADTILELGGSYTPTGTWTNMTLATPVINGLPTGTGIASGSTASTLAARDANANLTANNWIGGYATTATAAGTTTLTVSSAYGQFFTGSSTQIVTLPVASTLSLGHQFIITNNSTGNVTVNSSGGNAVLILAGGTSATFTCILASGTTAASWNASYFGDAVASGKKLAVSNTLTLAGTDNSTLNIGTGGTLGTNAYTSTAYAPLASPTFTGTVTLPSGQALIAPALGTPASANFSTGTFTWPTFNQSTTGSAATLTTARAIYGNNFDGTAALNQIIASTYGGTGNGFTKFSGPATTEKTKTLRDATDTILELGGSYTPTGTWTSLTLVTPVLGTPTSGNLANCTFPVLNQNTTGSAASLSISGQTGLITLTGIASTSRIKTVRDAADTILELGGSYTPTGTWTNMTLATPVINGLPTGTGIASAGTASTLAARDANANLTANNWIGGYATTATAAGTTTLTVSSAYVQFFTGSSTQTVTLPVASTLTLGHQFVIANNSTGNVTVNSSGANAVLVMAGGTSATFTCILASGTTAASWNASYFGDAVASGKKLTVSNSYTTTATDGSTVTFGAGGTVVYDSATQTLTNKSIVATQLTGTIASARLPAVIGASAYHNASQSITSATSTALAFNSERWDTDTMHDTVTNNGRIVCKTAGKFSMQATIEWAGNATGSRELWIRHTLASTAVEIISDTGLQPSTGTGAMVQSTPARVFDMGVNDYIEVFTYQNSGGALNVNFSNAYSPEVTMVWLGP